MITIRTVTQVLFFKANCTSVCSRSALWCFISQNIKMTCTQVLRSDKIIYSIIEDIRKWNWNLFLWVHGSEEWMTTKTFWCLDLCQGVSSLATILVFHCCITNCYKLSGLKHYPLISLKSCPLVVWELHLWSSTKGITRLSSTCWPGWVLIWSLGSSSKFI